MRWLGALLILSAAAGGFLLERRESLMPLRLAQALAVDLGTLSAGICRSRRPLPELLAKELDRGPAADALWQPLLALLEGDAGPLAACWGRACRDLPSPLDAMLAPLGPLLPEGGGALGRAIEETREELSGFVRAERERQSAAGRLTAAVCLSGACLGILVLM